MLGLVVLVIVAVVAVVGWAMLHRHGESDSPDASWRPTEESFRDPSSGRIMRVWIDPADESRHYVPETWRQ